MLKKLFSEAIENIREEKGAFFSSIISFILIFTLVNIFMFGVINTDAYRIRLEESNQAIIYINDLTAEEKTEFQNKLLSLEGVSSLRYTPKDVALKALEKDLDIDLSSSENPLQDAFFIFLTRDVNIDDLVNKLQSFSEIVEIDSRAKVINQTVEFSKSLDSFIKYASIALFVFTSIMIYNISSLSVKTRKREIHKNLLKGYSANFIKTTFFIESLFAITISSVISYALYGYISNNIINLIKTSSVGDFIFSTDNKEIYVLLIILSITIFISLIINYLSLNRYFTLNYYEKDKKEEIEEIVEEVIEETTEETSDEELEKLKTILNHRNSEEEENFDDFR